MAVREFTDSKNTVWRVWDVTTAQMHPATKREDYMGELADGWLAFESANEKRRLAAPYPADWATMPIPELEALCQRAPTVVLRPRSISGEQRVVAAEVLDREAVLAAVRTFTSPRGRVWTVRVHESPDKDGEGTTAVLRFTSDDVVIDLVEWPADWKDYTATQYAMLILDASPPRHAGAKGPQRRREDRRVDEPGVEGRAN